MKALITGITGFAGSHLAELLLEEGATEVHGVARPRSRMDHVVGIVDRIHLHPCDLTDTTSVNSVLARVRPDEIYHLAAQSFVPFSWDAPNQCVADNATMQINLFEGCRALGLDPPIQLACSSEEYGHVEPDEVPIKETNPLRPLSPYAVSKVTQDFLGYQYHESHGTRAIRTRGFNHTGPRRGEVFVTSNFAKQVAEMEKGLREPKLKCGNLEAVRDFTDVRDMVKGYRLAVRKAVPGEVYNLCSGKGYAISELVEMLQAMATVKFDIEQDPSRMRPSDVPRLLGDPSKFHAATGWQATIPFEQTLKDLLEYWRERVG